MEINEELLVQISESSRIKEKSFVLIPDSQGYARNDIEIEGCLEFVAIKKDVESSMPRIIMKSSLPEPIMDFVVESSGIYPIRFINYDNHGNMLHIMNYQHSKIPLKDNIVVEVSGGSPNERIEVLIRYV